eukprot:653138-Pyramimonas_sp.AAC.1
MACASSFWRPMSDMSRWRRVLATSTTGSQNESSGRPSSRGAESRATISDSVDECDTTVELLHTALTGKIVLGPTSAAKTRVVDLEE